jgi:hypothetical protein
MTALNSQPKTINLPTSQRARIFARLHLIRVAACADDPENFFAKKKNESCGRDFGGSRANPPLEKWR